MQIQVQAKQSTIVNGIMTSQLSIFTGETLKEKGMAKAIANANRVETGWSERAYQMFLKFIDGLPTDRKFMAETFRLYAFDHRLPAPPHLRAFGGIISRASNAGLIVRVTSAPVSNPKAHRALANVWRKT